MRPYPLIFRACVLASLVLTSIVHGRLEVGSRPALVEPPFGVIRIAWPSAMLGT